MRKRYHKIKAQLKAKTANAVRFAETVATGGSIGDGEDGTPTDGAKRCACTLHVLWWVSNYETVALGSAVQRGRCVA